MSKKWPNITNARDLRRNNSYKYSKIPPLFPTRRLLNSSNGAAQTAGANGRIEITTPSQEMDKKQTKRDFKKRV